MEAVEFEVDQADEVLRQVLGGHLDDLIGDTTGAGDLRVTPSG